MNSNTLSLRIEVDDNGSIKVRTLGRDLEETGAKGKKAGEGMDRAFGALKTTLGGIALMALAKQVVGVMDTYTQLESRLKLVTTGSENLAKVQQSLYDISLRTHVSQANTIELYTRMARATDQLGYSQATTLQITETINKAMIVSGATATESGAALIQLSQGLASGTLRGEEFNSVMEQTPRLARAIADGLGVQIGQLRAMAEQGKLTSEVVTRALISQKEAIEREFGQMKTTIGQAMTDLGTVFQNLVHEADKGADGTGRVVRSIQDLTTTIEQNKGAILSLFEGIVSGAARSVEGVGNIVRGIQGLAIVAASEDKTLWKWITAGPEEMKKWQQEIDNGTAFLKDRLVQVRNQIQDTADSWGYWSEKKGKIEALRAEEKALLAQIEQRGKVEAKVGAASVVSTEKAIMPVAALKDAWQVYSDLRTTSAKDIEAAEDRMFKAKQKLLADEAAARKKHAEEVLSLEATLTDEIKRGTLSRYEYAVWALDQETAKRRQLVGENQARQEQITEAHRIGLMQAGQFSNMYASEEQERLTTLKDFFMQQEEDKTAAVAENYQKQEALRAELEVYLGNAGNDELARALARLEKEYQKKVEIAGKDKMLQQQLAEWKKSREEQITRENQERMLQEKLRERDIVANHLHDLTLKHQDHFRELTALEQMWAETSKTIKTELGNALVEEFGNIGGAWGALWDSMLMKMGEVAAEMAVTWTVSQIGNLFEGWNIYHAGIWNLREDEVPSILQQGEMVIPADVAADIRDNMGNNGPDNWGGLLDATQNYGADNWGSETDGMVAGSLGRQYGGMMTSGVLGMVTGQLSPTGFMSGIMSPETAVSAIGTAFAETSVSPFSPEKSNFSNFGAATGKGFSIAGLAGAGLPGFAIGALSSLGGLVGGWMGDLIGDLMDARSLSGYSIEAILDALEEGLITKEQADMAIASASGLFGWEMSAISSSSSTLGGLVDSVSGALGSLGSFVSDLLDGFISSNSDIGYNDSGFSNYGGDLYGESTDPAGYYGGGESTGSSASGSGIGGVSGADLGKGDEGWAKGGIVDRLLVPKGEDGWGALKLGEGVIDADTMKILSSAIRSGQFTGNDGSSEEMLALLWTIASSTKKAADILTRFEYTGIPQSERRAVA